MGHPGEGGRASRMDSASQRCRVGDRRLMRLTACLESAFNPRSLDDEERYQRGEQQGGHANVEVAPALALLQIASQVRSE